MQPDRETETLFAKYRFLHDAVNAVRAGKRFSEDEKEALRARYAAVAQGVLAEKAKGFNGELFVTGMMLLEVLCPDVPRVEAVAIEKVTPIPKVKLKYGLEAASLQFVEPARAQWSKQNCEFLVGFPTGLLAPFEKVFVKRVRGQPVSGHDLLMKLTGRALPFSPTFLGYVESKSGSHVYFFENLAPGFVTLESGLNNNAIICPRIITDVVRNAARLFSTIDRFGFVYTDFCSKNVMVERDTRAIAIIDIDSCVPVEMFLKPDKPEAGWQTEFWGLWNQHLRKTRPVRVENAQKSVVLSFAALWCRALALKYSTGGAGLTALKLVHNPSYEAQRALWEALLSRKRQGFRNYFNLSENATSSLYNQWQTLFDAFKAACEVPWQEIVSATENLAAVVGRNSPK